LTNQGKSKYSYHHIVNTSIALEHYGRLKHLGIKIGRPRKPKRIINLSFPDFFSLQNQLAEII